MVRHCYCVLLLPRTSGNITASPPAFTCFADFPFDIRVCIWDNVAFLPRDIDLWAQGLGTIATSSSQPHEFTLFRYVTTQPPPAILHVNEESRAIDLKYCSLEFGLSYEIPRHYDLRAGSPPKTYTNVRCDRSCITSMTMIIHWHLPGHGKPASIELLPTDIRTEGNRGLCFGLHTRLQAVGANSDSEWSSGQAGTW